jgi:hypothetical protein
MFRIQKNIQNNDSNDLFKKQLIDYIYQSIDISKFKYEILQYYTELSQLLKQKYFVSANFSGSNCLYIFTKIKDKYYSYLIDRKTLSYNVSKINFDNIKMINTKVKLDPSIYLGTIFDGIFVQNKNEKMFIITDVFLFKGQDFTNTHIDTKLHSIFAYLKSNYDESDKENNIILTVNKLYEFNKTEHLINNVIPKMKDMSVRGICFYPEMSNTKLIYLFGNENKETDISQSNFKPQIFNNPTNFRQQTNYAQQQHTNYAQQQHTNYAQQQPNKINNNIITNIEIPKIIKQCYIPKKGKKDSEYTFEMKKDIKNINSDVYILNVVETVIKENLQKPLLKRKKVGIAYIPTAQKSSWCKKEMENNESILVSCKFHENKNKWEPNSISNAKRPSFNVDFDIVS